MAELLPIQRPWARAGDRATHPVQVLGDIAHPTDKVSRDVFDAVRQITQASQAYDLAERVLNGDVNDLYEDDNLRDLITKNGMIFGWNLCAPVVDHSIDKLAITGWTADNDQANQALQDIVLRNNMLSVAMEMHSDVCTYGDGHLQVGEDDDDPSLPGPAIRITKKAPIMCRPVYDPERPWRVLYYATMWVHGEKLRLNLDYPYWTERWITADNVSWDRRTGLRAYLRSTPAGRGAGTGGSTTDLGDVDWVPVTDDSDVLPSPLIGEDGLPVADMNGYYEESPTETTTLDGQPVLAWPVPNPTGRIPLFHFREGIPFGQPQHFRIYKYQNMAHTIAVIAMAVLVYAGFPMLVLLQDVNDIDKNVAEGLGVPDGLPEFVDNPTSGSGERGHRSQSTVRTGPNQVLEAFAKQLVKLDGADPKGLIAMLDRLGEAAGSATRTPLYVMNGMDPAVSMPAHRADEGPHNRKIERLRLLLDATWRQFWTYVLDCAGYPDANVTTTWQNVETIDPTEEVEIAQGKLAAGVDPKQVWLEMGYTEEQAEEWLEAKAAAEQLEALATLGPALMADIQSGAVTPEQVRTAIEQAKTDPDVFTEETVRAQ